MSDAIVVRSPYDSAEVGRVPRHGPDDIDRAVASAAAALRDQPFPPWRRAAVLDAAARLLSERAENFARTLVNEVPTWRADQMPYGGVRESGNTKEGPAYAVRQMTEERLVVIQP
jgi:acyl-CoA reductase-like NAD-dependent aldehyde dehydrogenase